MASQHEVPRYQQHEEGSYGSQSSDMNGRRASEVNYSAQSRHDRSNNVRMNIFQPFLFYACYKVRLLTNFFDERNNTKC